MATTFSGTKFAIGRGKQAGLANGAAFDATKIVAPTQWPRWLDGTEHDIDATYEAEMEGDGTRGESIDYKEFQVGMATVSYNPRPNELAQAFAAYIGKASDNIGTAASGVMPHSIYHPATDQGNDYFTLTSPLRGAPYAMQTFDAICHRLHISGQAGKRIKVEETWHGGGNQILSSASAFTPAPDSAKPFLFAGSSFTVTPTAVAGLFAAVTQFDLTFESRLEPREFQAMGIFPLPLVAGNETVSGTITAQWQDATVMQLAFLGAAGATTPDVTTATATQTGSGNVQLNLYTPSTPTGQGATLELPNVTYRNPKFRPSIDGRSILQTMDIHAIKGTTTTVAPGTANVAYAILVNCTAAAAF